MHCCRRKLLLGEWQLGASFPSFSVSFKDEDGQSCGYEGYVGILVTSGRCNVTIETPEPVFQVMIDSSILRHFLCRVT